MSEVKQYYIGWDVGAWSCTKKSKSCDAMVILNNEASVPKYLRDSLKEIINNSTNAKEFLTKIFNKSGLSYKGEEVILAIDAPLGYSEAFKQLIINNTTSEIKFDVYQDNPYLFRETECHIFKNKIFNKEGKAIRPLSAVNDMIGSQSTKAIHVVSRFTKIIKETGVWTDNDKLTIIETYPSINRAMIDEPATLKEEHIDIRDAYICAKIAYAFRNQKERFVKPEDGIPKKEGWIWYLGMPLQQQL